MDCLGKTKEQAIDLIEQLGYRWRMSMEDGKAYILTMDYCTGRINLIVENGIVVRTEVG